MSAINDTKRAPAERRPFRRHQREEHDHLRNQPGDAGLIQRVAMGNTDEELARAIELQVADEQQQRPWIFQRKLGRGVTTNPGDEATAAYRLPSGRLYQNPFLATTAAVPTPPTRCIGVEEFADLYAAAAFASSWGHLLDTHLTLTWNLMGVSGEADVRTAFEAFLKCLRAWLADRGFPRLWIWTHENGPRRGLHTHIALWVPDNTGLKGGQWRTQFRKWVRAWASKKAGGPAPRAVRVRDNGGKVSSFNHWTNFSYLVKGYDRHAVVVSAKHACDGQAIRLGDLIAFDWRDPGPVQMKRTGVSRELSARQREIGHPGFAAGNYRSSTPVAISVSQPDDLPNCSNPWTKPPWAAPEIPARFFAPYRDYVPTELRPPPFRSPFDDGVRDVRDLYLKDFVDVVQNGHGAVKARAAEARAEAAERARQAVRDAKALRRDEELSRLSGLDLFG